MQGPGVDAGPLRSQRLLGVAVIGIIATLSLSACGEDGESTVAEESTPQPKPQASGFAEGGKGGSRKGSATIALHFPEPKAQPGSPQGTREAIADGRKACAGKTPVQVRDEFLAEAEAAGTMNEGQEKLVSEIEKFEGRVSADFVAGQLAAGVYEATLPEAFRIPGYQGCVYELAQQLQKEIAKR